jgi:hypothetical protein
MLGHPNSAPVTAMQTLPMPHGDALETLYGPATKVRTPEEAAAYMAELVRLSLLELPEQTPEQALAVQRENLGYFGGYLSHEDRLRLEELFGVQHPFFGPASAGPVDPDVAFAIGEKLGRRHAHGEHEH